MLANRMIKIAEDIQEDFSQFNIIALLAEAAALSEQRPNLNPQQYRQQIAVVRQKADEIIKKTKFRNYPPDLLDTINESNLRSLLPATVAQLLVDGFPETKDAAISSAELHMFRNEATTALGQINGFLAFAQRLKLQSFDVPLELVALDLKFPRPMFENKLRQFSLKLQNFNEFIKSATELGTGSRGEIELLYLSTTEPLISFIINGGAAWAVLAFYKMLLEVAEKHLSIYLAIKQLKDAGISPEEIAPISERTKQLMQVEITKGIEAAIARIEPKVDNSRQNEIKVQITKQAIEISTDIANGARIQVSLENQQQIEMIASAAPELFGGPSQLRKQLEEQVAIEKKLAGITATEPTKFISDLRESAPVMPSTTD